MKSVTAGINFFWTKAGEMREESEGKPSFSNLWTPRWDERETDGSCVCVCVCMFSFLEVLEVCVCRRGLLICSRPCYFACHVFFPEEKGNGNIDYELALKVLSGSERRGQKSSEWLSPLSLWEGSFGTRAALINPVSIATHFSIFHIPDTKPHTRAHHHHHQQDESSRRRETTCKRHRVQ